MISLNFKLQNFILLYNTLHQVPNFHIQMSSSCARGTRTRSDKFLLYHAYIPTYGQMMKNMEYENYYPSVGRDKQEMNARSSGSKWPAQNSKQGWETPHHDCGTDHSTWHSTIVAWSS